MKTGASRPRFSLRRFSTWPPSHAPPSTTIHRICLQRALPAVLLRVGDVLGLVKDAPARLAANPQRFIAGRSTPRRTDRVKSHPRFAYKG